MHVFQIFNGSLPKNIELCFCQKFGKFLEEFLTRYYGKFFVKNAYLHINALNMFEVIHPLVYDNLVAIYTLLSKAKNFIY
jgi:hypothetical protein